MMEREQIVDRIRTRVLIADNTLIHTQLLADALRRDRNLDVFTTHPDVKSLIAATVEHDVDVLVVSSNLEEYANRGLDVLRAVRATRSKVRPVVLLDSSRVELVLDAFRAGARGVISRIESVKTLAKCIRCVRQGQVWANSQEISLALEALASAHRTEALDAKSLSLLSKREMEIVKNLAAGLTNREIAERLKISQHTVKNYLFRVFDKVGASNRIELLLMTLSQDNGSEAASNSVSKNFSDTELENETALGECQKAAEQGQLNAQLALAGFLWNRKAGSGDVVQAYKWYQIADNQLQHMSKAVSRTMTMEQIVQSERLAADWLKNSQKIPASSVTEIRDRRAENRMDTAYIPALRVGTV